MFGKLGRFVAYHPVVVLCLWLGLGLAAFCFAPPFEERCQEDDIHSLPKRCLSVQGLELLQRAFPKEAFGSKLVLACVRPGATLTETDLAYVDRLAQELRRFAADDPGQVLRTVTSRRDPLIGSRLISEDRQCTLVMAALETPFMARATTDRINSLEKDLQPHLQARPAGLEVAFTGPAAIGRDLNDASRASLENTTWATFILIVVVLLLIYRAPILACIPLCTIAVAVWLSLRVLALLTLALDVHLINLTRIFVVVVLYGAGTDYCLFLVSRYREELQGGRLPADAIAHGIKRVGGALLASAATIVVGLGLMGFSEFAKLRHVGPAVALCLSIAFVASLTLAPALLALLGRWAFWPGSPVTLRLAAAPDVNGNKPSHLWRRFSDWVTLRPLCVWAVTVLILLPLAWLGLNTEGVFAITSELPRQAQSRRGLEIIKDHFAAGELGPLTVLIESQENWDSPAGRATLAKLARTLGELPNVAEVRCLTQPLGDHLGDLPSPLSEPPSPASEPPSPLWGEGSGVRGALARLVAKNYYVASVPPGQVTRLDVVTHTDPFTKESTATMLAVRAVLDDQLAGRDRRILLYGITPINHDTATVHHADRLRINALVLGGIYLILLCIVRRPLFAVYLLASVLFSYYVTIGATELLSYGWLDSDLGKLDWKVPFFLFTILVAIGEDYNIFLMTRVLEEARRSGMREGIRKALAQTGGTITSCGLIMAGTFATLMLCPLATLAQLGLALAFGVLLDTFVVRTVLVPTFLMLIDRSRKPPAEPAHPVELRQSA